MKHVKPILVILSLALAACSGGGDDAGGDRGQDFIYVEEMDADGLMGSWASAAEGDCARPDFVISRDELTSELGLAVAANFNGWDQTGRIEPGGEDITFIDPTKHLPAALEKGALRLRAPADGVAVLGSRNIFAEGALFRKCAARG